MTIDLSRRSFLSMTGLAAVLAAVLSGRAQGGATSTAAASNDSASSVSSSTLSMGTSADSKDESLVDAFYSHVKSVTSLAKTYPAGEKVVGVALEYDTDIDASSLSQGGQLHACARPADGGPVVRVLCCLPEG